MSLLQVQDVVKDFSGHRALDHVSMDVPPGSVYGLLGPNGAGKTTLLRIINQITAPDEGRILFDGRPLRQEDRMNIGYLPEERGLYKKMKVGEQALYLAQLKGLSRPDAMKALRHWFEKFEIGAWWDKKVEELSKGMAQKVQFITTVLHKPGLLIFDEPFSGFDPINVNLLKQEILALKEEGATIIFSTHNMASVEELCSHITLIHKSKAILDGEIGTIRNQYRTNRYRIGFRGDPRALESGLDKRFALEEVVENGMGNHAVIRMDRDESTAGLLQNLVAVTEVRSFEEILPGMNDIFIEVVHRASAGKTQDHE
ncbi:MAG: ATP-binding cassette domain-containing protein [Bacteroidales bacterium]